jgi:signal transduction histidine kinase
MLGLFFKKLAISSNISTYLSRTLIIITVATTVIIGGVMIFQQSLYFNKISKQKNAEYIENQKNYIKEIVDNEFEYIRIQNEVFKKNINDKIKQNVNQAYNTAESIYQKYVGKKSEEEIKALIVATISSLRFDMEYEEVFISTMDGTGVYYPRKPEFTGKDMSLFKDSNGLSVVQKEINLLKLVDEGFIDYDLNSKAILASTPHKKITFVKKFQHFNWYFGSKQYLNDYFPKFRDEIAQKISSVRFRNGGYVFMNNMNGTPIVMDGSVYKGNFNMLTSTDDPRHNVFLQELDLLKKDPDGGYFYYKWNKINETSLSEKCSYVRPFHEYNWIIGAGFYLDEIDQSIKQQQALLHKDQRNSIIIILIIFFILLFFEVLIIYHFNSKYKSDFDRFFNFFFSLQTNFNQIKTSDLYFDEFKRAGLAANEMVLSRQEIEHRLIKEQKRATESDRLKSAFLANMSHEIRTPMNAILGFSELLEDESQDELDKVLFIKLIRKNGEILLNLINDIIDISKIEANLLSIRKRPLNLNKFLNEVSNHYIETIAARNDRKIKFLTISNIEPDQIVITDEIRLRQIFDNLIGNAIKFTPEGSITLNVKKEGEAIYYSVSDTGIGIPDDQQSTIFERFMQAEHDHGVNFGGTGLGLAISKNLIELLGGSLHVDSKAGKGSIFYFQLPID